MEPAKLRYVVLRHEGVAEPHFDFMVETSPGSRLATWRLPAWPPTADAPLLRLGNHRTSYLTYEGPVSGDRGVVRRVASGTCQVSGTDSGQWIVRFDGGDVLRLVARGDGDLWAAQSFGVPPGV